MNTRLVILAHGSNDPVWCDTFERLLSRLVVALGSERVRLAYMQFVEPTLDTVADEASRQEIDTLKVMPLFLSAGGHVRDDVPRLVQQARQRHPGLSIEVLPPVGEHPGFRNLVVGWAYEAMR